MRLSADSLTQPFAVQVGHYLFHHSLARRQTEESIAAFLAGAEKYELTVAEQLQLINLCPTTLVEVYLSIDEAEHRLGEDSMAELLNLIMETLYLPEDQVPAPFADDEPILKEQKKNPNKDRQGGRGRGSKRGGRPHHKGQQGGRGRGAPRDRK